MSVERTHENMAKRPRQRKSSSNQNGPSMVFDRRSYLLLLLGVVIIVVGYVMMRAENQVRGFISLYVAPILIMGGYLEIIYAILRRSKSEEPASSQ